MGGSGKLAAPPPLARPAERASWGSLLRQREFGSLFTAHLLSLLGDRAATVAVSVLVYDRSHSVWLTAAAYSTSMLPWLLGAPVLAVLADRWPRRRVMVSCDLLRAALVALLLLPGVPLPVLLLVLTAIGWLAPPFETARAAALTVVLPRPSDYVAGSALTMLSSQASQVLGLAGGGLLLAALSPRQLLGVDAGTFVVSAVLVLVGMRARPSVASLNADAREPTLVALRRGVQAVFGDATLRGLLLLAWLVAAFTVVPEGLAVSTSAALGAPEAQAGVLLAAVPLGAAIGAVVLGRASDDARRRYRLPLALLGMVSLALSSGAPSWPVLFLAWALTGVGASVQMALAATFMLRVPDELRARAFGLAQSGLMAGQALALLLAGAAASQFGWRWVLLVLGLSGLLLVALLSGSLQAAGRHAAPGPTPAGLADRLLGRLSVGGWIVAVTVLAAGAAGLTVVLAPHRASPHQVPVWLMALAFAATGSYVASVRIGRQTHVLSLDDIPRLLGLFFMAPGALLVARLLGAAVALVLWRRQRGQKLVFNLANFALEATVAVAVFAALDPGGGIGPRVWPVAVVATLAADVVSAWSVRIVIGLAEGDLRLRGALRPERITLATAMAAAVVGLIAATTVWYSPQSSALLLILAGLGGAGLRGFARLEEEAREQGRLQETLRTLGNLEPTSDTWTTVLTSTRELLAVERLDCWVAGAEGPSPFRGWYRNQTDEDPLPADDAEALELHALLMGSAATWPDGVTRLLSEAGTIGALVGPPRRWQQQGRLAPPARLAVLLPGPQPSPVGSTDPRTPPVGVLVFSAPLAHASQWSRSQVELAQTVAESFGQALRRVQQRHELMVASQRDQLTGLHNLTSFRQRVAEERGSSCAVLMINLARLRAVNDVFGRDTGDAMIASAAARLADVAPDATLGRISGHHLAAAIDVETPGAAVHLARRVRTALEAPLQTDGLNAELGVTIGIALGPEHGSEPDLLLRRAEAAGDAAKEDPFGVAVFSPELEHDVARPLRLVSDLRKALAADDQLSLHYQPQLRLRDGQITSYEALIRWNHPTLGPVRPDEFIGLAESTGLISAVTDFTLDEALRQAAQWRRQGRPDRVAVNLSARTLLDDGLVRKVERLLAEHGCEPGQLILEITETSVMAQPMRSVLMLDALADLGVELSIDDFGTGYSNLAYLRDLPVHEVKLDRTFISSPHDGMPLGQGGLRAQAFLRHAIALVHALQLRVVVEGVEDALALHALRELGADAAQGYHICRPLPEAELQAWFESGPFATATDLGYGTRS